MIYFVSDLHFWHVNILKYTRRPWSTLEEMHKQLITLYNSKVSSQTDEVYFLGDLIMGGGKDMPQRMEEIFPKLNGKKYLIKGNHDYKYCGQPWYSQYFEWTKDVHELKVKGYPLMVLCHFPMYSWHGMGRESIMLHGHCHGNIDTVNLNTRRIDVGVDAMYSNYMPISIEEVCHIMNGRKTQLVDHHGSRENVE